MSLRRKGREMALQMLYQSDLGGCGEREVLAMFQPLDGDGQPFAAGEGRDRSLRYAHELFHGTIERREQIDRLIREQAQHWRLERMPSVDRNILRLAVFEFLYEPDIPKLVVLNEAIELAKRYGGDDSGRFVNGLLDGMLKTHTFPGRMT